ncbi:unnamed protein product [Closterium sp. NIES-65]|nr:unnamed protein product [Closterium sp. NIES-65]
MPDRNAAPLGRGRGAGGGAGGGEEEEEEEEEDTGKEKKEVKYDEHQKFDEFEGNDMGLFATGEYDEDDKDADAVWDSVDDRMDDRRRDRREARLKEEIEKYRASNPKITEQFADLKRGLGQMSTTDWDSIPEIGDYSLRNKKKRFESFVPVPDTLLEKARQEKEHVSALDPKGKGAVLGGTETPFASQTPVTDLTAVGEGRGTVLSLKLDRLSDSVTGQTVVDPKGYLTDLKSMRITSDAEISDIKKARLLLKSVIQTNPKHAPGWIAAARLEELAGKLQAARGFIQRGCQECPKNEDVWLEACRLSSPDAARAVIARGVKEIPTSVKLWMHAARLEKDDVAKSRVLRKALEHVPDSVRLWKAVVELAKEDDARILLSRAVECCPLHVELWLALARLEVYENAKRVLNKAREALPTEPAIWIAAAKLEEANDNEGMVGKIIERAIRGLQREGVVIDREAWMREAEAAERAGSVATCRAIIRSTVGMGVEEEDRKRTWVADAEECIKRGSVETARAIFAHVLTVFPGKKSVWRRAAQLEKTHGTRESLDALLRRAVTYCPQAEVLWLMGAKEKWLAGDVPGARAILEEAYAAIPDSEEIWLAAFKLEFENREPERARRLLAKAREMGGTERVWMKSAILEREVGDVEEEKFLLESGLRLFPRFHKLWLMLGQLEARQGRTGAAREIFQCGLKNCPGSIFLWLCAAKLEEDLDRKVDKARNWFGRAVTLAPEVGDFWAQLWRFEKAHGSEEQRGEVVRRCVAAEPSTAQGPPVLLPPGELAGQQRTGPTGPPPPWGARWPAPHRTHRSSSPLGSSLASTAQDPPVLLPTGDLAGQHHIGPTGPPPPWGARWPAPHGTHRPSSPLGSSLASTAQDPPVLLPPGELAGQHRTGPTGPPPPWGARWPAPHRTHRSSSPLGSSLASTAQDPPVLLPPGELAGQHRTGAHGVVPIVCRSLSSPMVSHGDPKLW